MYNCSICSESLLTANYALALIIVHLLLCRPSMHIFHVCCCFVQLLSLVPLQPVMIAQDKSQSIELHQLLSSLLYSLVTRLDFLTATKVNQRQLVRMTIDNNIVWHQVVVLYVNFCKRCIKILDLMFAVGGNGGWRDWQSFVRHVQLELCIHVVLQLWKARVSLNTKEHSLFFLVL